MAAWWRRHRQSDASCCARHRSSSSNSARRPRHAMPGRSVSPAAPPTPLPFDTHAAAPLPLLNHSCKSSRSW
eukprot:5616552-Prymnesium_polylepis.1